MPYHVLWEYLLRMCPISLCVSTFSPFPAWIVYLRVYVERRVQGPLPAQCVLIPQASSSALIPGWLDNLHILVPRFQSCVCVLGSAPSKAHFIASRHNETRYLKICNDFLLPVYLLAIYLAFLVTRKPSQPKAPELFLGMGGLRVLTVAWFERSLLATACTLINN